MPILEANLIKQCLVASWKEEAPFPETLKLAYQAFLLQSSFLFLGSANTFYKVLVVNILSFMDHMVSAITTQCYCYSRKTATDNM